MKSGNLLVLATFFILITSIVHAQNENQVKIDSLLYRLTIAKEDTDKLYIYLNLIEAHFYFNTEKGLLYEKPALEIAEKLKWKSGIARIKNAIGRICWRIGKFDDALKHHFDALLLFTEVNDESSSTRCLINIGQDYADGGKYAQALIFFTKALRKYEANDNKEDVAEVLMLLSWVHSNMGNLAESTKLNYEVLKTYEELGDKYGIAITTSNIGSDNFELGNYPEAIIYYNRAIKALLESNDLINLLGCYNSLANIYQINGNYPEAIKNYSMALQIAEKINERFGMANAYRGLGNVYRSQNNFSEALKNYSKGVDLYKSISNKQELSRLYSELGICYSKLNRYVDAKNSLEKAFALSKELKSNVSYKDYYQGKEILDSSTGRWESAYKNYKQFIVLRDSIYNKDNLKKMFSTKMQYDAEKTEAIEKAEREKKEAFSKAEQEKKDIRQRTIRNTIAGVLAGSLIFLVVVYRQRNKISKARKRSDELLLNILPREVAEELKDKGSAEARHFNEVTVMFTDFKGFTKISEKLTPAELVAEIDVCFKAFDNIIGKYNIEKIKTIGDAYMCAGGLPVPNKSHADDVVKAALEIKKFMLEHLQKRKSEGKENFEIRIGIHTGHVVAGIVGVKKFAYDIWGDTVNLASRMESSGEAGKVNISGSTYELVKNKFTCTHRGKIQAKNKGEIDMYFVEAVSEH